MSRQSRGEDPVDYEWGPSGLITGRAGVFWAAGVAKLVIARRKSGVPLERKGSSPFPARNSCQAATYRIGPLPC